ncbi:hypothetical protein D9V41_06190 [Aeromicrobium phragmitis]|uniref:AbiTii domain-containing protein n=1 Tax=Aeromicrobium phragmitis TaxID=2478914 RepID=A0A3L8PMW9_9ACTN|nr:hypothetical protein [Aeromicrobium phragmitis]RLV56651.1 hypothetical protein D9V41_06190 [Aeromicrobium phragmitis]
MDRQAEALRLAEALLEDIELQRLKASEIVLKASRLARLVGHDDLQEFLSLEREGYAVRQPAKWISKAGRWVNDDREKYIPIPLVRVEAMREGARQAMEALRGGGNFSGDNALIASRNHDERITSNADVYGRLDAICGQVVATTYDMVADVYHELLFSELQATLFAQAQADVDGTLAEAGGSALDKIEKVSARLRDGDPESVSQALTTCRRLIDAVADHVFPAVAESYEAGGHSLEVGQQQVLNRLQAHVHSTGASHGRRDRIRRALKDLYSRCSAGTHSEVSVQEARFVFLQTYVLLGEVLTLAGDARENE